MGAVKKLEEGGAADTRSLLVGSSFSKCYSLINSACVTCVLIVSTSTPPFYCKTFPGWLLSFPLQTSYPYLFLIYFTEYIQCCPHSQGCKATTGTECLLLSISTGVQGLHWTTHQWSQPQRKWILTPSAATACLKLLSYGRDIMTSYSTHAVMLPGLILYGGLQMLSYLDDDILHHSWSPSASRNLSAPPLRCSLSLGCMSVIQTSHLQLSIPQSPLLCTLTCDLCSKHNPGRLSVTHTGLNGLQVTKE